MKKELLTPRDDIFTIEGFLSPEECDQLIERAEGVGFGDAPITTAAGPVIDKGMRNNERVMLDDVPLAAAMWAKLNGFVPEKHGCRAIGLNERFRFYKYEPGQYFDWHFDGYFERHARERSMLTFMVYLNDCEGGTTDFIFKTGAVREEDTAVRVKPVKGTALLFIHHVLHRGAPVTGGKKYVLRSDVMYRL